MFDDPSESPTERSITPADRAREKADEFRMHAELAAVFEAPRKFGAQVLSDLGAEVARDLQRTIGKVEKARLTETPVLPPDAWPDASTVLAIPKAKELSTQDYHIHRRPGEVMMARWLTGDQVETFYERLQAHFDAAVGAFREEERQSNEWKQDPATLQYLDALDKLEYRMADRYLRPIIRQHKIFVLSTQAADEMDIMHLCDYLMGMEAADVVGKASAPPEEEPTERDRAWFFKLFSLRGIVDDAESMCFFTYLQKSDEGW